MIHSLWKQIMMYYIPRRVVLPFGFTVGIKQLRKKAWKKVYDEAFSDGGHKDTAAFNVYKDNKATIYLQLNRSPQERKEDLVHELQHVMVEYQEYVKEIQAHELPDQ